MVITTELQPLTESIYLEASSSVEQWKSDNIPTGQNSQWSPDRTATPLQLTPKITAVDTETNMSYTPSVYKCKWYVMEYDASATNSTDSTVKGDYVETEVTSTSTEDDYYKTTDGKTLTVRKNVPYDHAVTIRCVATYQDPRDSGTTHDLEVTQILSTNRDAEAVYPILDTDVPSAQSFNPLTDSTYDDDGEPHGYFSITAKALLNNEDITSNIVIVWYAVDSSGNEVLADTMPWYVSGQNTATIKVDAMYGEYIRILVRAKATSDTEDLYPSRCYRTVGWRVVYPQINTVSPNGSAFRSTFTEMTFQTMANLKGRVMDDTIKAKHILFKWITRKSNATEETERGWGQEITLPKDVLGSSRVDNVLPSTLVIPFGYLLGPYEPVTDDGNVVTDDDGNIVYDRAISM